MTITPADVQGTTWVTALDKFVEDADYLTDADMPQLKALYAIAKTLDGGKFQAALISQFTLTQRNLTQKRGAGEPGAGRGDALDAFMSDPTGFLQSPM